MNDDNLDFDTRGDVPSVTDLIKQFPNLPPKVLVTLAVLSLMARSVTPFRLCACGCGESVHGKARLASAACRQRVSREARAVRATAPTNFNLVLQDEIPVPIPFSPAPRDHGSEIFQNDHVGAVWSAGQHWFIRLADGSAKQVSRAEAAKLRRDHGSAPLTLDQVLNAPDKCDASETVELSEPTPEISEPVRWMEVAQAGRLSPADCARNWIQNYGGLYAALAHVMECQASNSRVGLFENAASYDSLIVCMDAMRRGLIPLVKPTSQPHEPELFREL